MIPDRSKQPWFRISGRVLVCALLIAACLSLAPAGICADDFPDRPRRILIIPSYNFDYKGIQWFLQGVMAEFAEHKIFQVTLSLENMQLAAHPSDRKYMDAMAASLKIKYSIEKPDLIIIQYKQALQFMERYGKEIFGNVPVVFAGLTVEGYIPDRLPRHYTGIMASFSATKNIELILKNHPNVRKIYIIGGVSPVEQSMVNEAIAEGAPYRGKVEFIALTDMTFPALLTVLGKIQDNSAIIYQALQLDAAGKVLVPAQAAIEIARAARVPVYGMLDTYMGSGITGGFLIHHEGLGRRAADIAMQWLQTGLAPDTRVKSEPIGSYRFDGRQLKRWGIREDSLPAESKIEFKAFSVWDSYKREIAGGICLILLQAVLIIALLRNRRARIKTTDALKETERFKSNLLDKMNEAQQMAMIGSWEWDLQTNRVWWSDETYRIFGVTPQDFVPGFEANGKFIHPDDFERYGKSFDHSFQTGEPLDVDLRVVAANGQLKYCHARGKIIYDDSGKAIHFIGTIMDITERKWLERSLVEKEVRLSTLVQTIPDLIWLKDVDGFYLACNKMFEKFFGARETDIIGKTDYDFVDTDLADFFREHDRKAMAADKPRINEEWLTFAEDGYRALFETIKTPLYDAEGKLIGVLGISRDITARKLAEETLQKSQQEYRDLFENSVAGIFRSRLDGSEVMNVNDAFCELFEYSREDMLSESATIRWANQKIREEMIKMLNNKGKVTNFEADLITKSGRIRQCLLSVKLYQAEGYLEGTIIDITELKQAELQREAALEEIRKLNEGLEQRIAQRTAELTKTIAQLEETNRVFVGRELKMMELKERIAKLEGEK